MTHNTPDFFEPLVGWRAWSSADPRTGNLKALAMSYYWLPGQPTRMRCNQCHSFAKPDTHNGGGLHAFQTVQQLIEDRAYGSGMIIGQVYLWGTVVVCTRGYRAEYAYPKALLCESQTLADLLAKKWGVPCEIGDIAKLFNEAKARAYAKIYGNADIRF